LSFSGGTSALGLRTDQSASDISEDDVFRSVLTPVNLVATVVDVGGVPTIVVNGATGNGVGNVGGVNGVEFRFTISNNANDADGDGIVNSLDTDSDNDGLSDLIEAQTNASLILLSGEDLDFDGLDDAFDPDFGGSPLTPVTTAGQTVADYLNASIAFSAAPSGGDDRLQGDGTGEIIDAGAGADVVLAGGGNDNVEGDEGNDLLFGEAGDDTLIGGAGEDILYGGDGIDTFKFDGSDISSGSVQQDIVKDFAILQDVLDISGLLDLDAGNTADAATLDGYFHFEKDGDDTVIHLNKDGDYASNTNEAAKDEHTIRLEGVDLTAYGTDQQIIENLMGSASLVTDI